MLEKHCIYTDHEIMTERRKPQYIIICISLHLDPRLDDPRQKRLSVCPDRLDDPEPSLLALCETLPGDPVIGLDLRSADVDLLKELFHRVHLVGRPVHDGGRDGVERLVEVGGRGGRGQKLTHERTARSKRGARNIHKKKEKKKNCYNTWESNFLDVTPWLTAIQEKG